MGLFLRFSLLLLLVFITWAVFYLATIGDSGQDLSQAGHMQGDTISASSSSTATADNSMQSSANEQSAADSSAVSQTARKSPEKQSTKLSPDVAAQMRELGKRNHDEMQAVERQDGSVRLDFNGNYKTVVGAVIDNNGQLRVIEGVPASTVNNLSKNNSGRSHDGATESTVKAGVP